MRGIGPGLLAAAGVALMVLAGCGSAPSASPAGSSSPSGSTAVETIAAGKCNADGVCLLNEVAAWRGLPFTSEVRCGAAATDTCRLLMDIHAPTRVGRWPIVVLEPGGPIPPTSSRNYLEDLALEVADRGAVVITANWRESAEFGGMFPDSFQDVACAVGVARAIGPDYGADPSRVVLVGHSLGAYGAAVEALTPAPGPSVGAWCNATAGSLRPDALVTVAGYVGPTLDPTNAYVIALLGGDRAAQPAAWAAADPWLLAAATVTADRIPVAVVQGLADDQGFVQMARWFQPMLVQNGYAATLLEIPDADHFGVTLASETIDAIMELTAAK